MWGMAQSAPRDRQTPQVTEKLTFIEINPGLGSFGFAAESAGMLRLGPVLLSRDVRDAYISFHGAGSDELVSDSADLAIADLPFTLFLDGRNADPDVVDAVVAARGHIRRGGTAIFRVKWDIGIRLGVAHEEYVEVVRAHFPKYDIASVIDRSSGSDQVETADLYIVASPKALLLPPPVADAATGVKVIHPLKLSEPSLEAVDPQLIFESLGFPEDFHAVADTVPHVHDRLRECVAIQRAKVVIEAVASHIRG